MLTFDEAEHRYWWDGKPVPNVTGILAPESPYKDMDPAMLDIARQKGQHVHRMIELDVRGTLDESTLPDWMRPALVEWRRFVSDTRFVMNASELRVFHPTFRYAGTLDLMGTFFGHDPVLIDLKRSFLGGHVIGLQTAAYLEAYHASLPREERSQKREAATKRYALRLREDGRYKLEQFDDPLDRTDFLAALALHNRRTRHA